VLEIVNLSHCSSHTVAVQHGRGHKFEFLLFLGRRGQESAPATQKFDNMIRSFQKSCCNMKHEDMQMANPNSNIMSELGLRIIKDYLALPCYLKFVNFIVCSCLPEIEVINVE